MANRIGDPVFRGIVTNRDGEETYDGDWRGRYADAKSDALSHRKRSDVPQVITYRILELFPNGNIRAARVLGRDTVKGRKHAKA